MIAEFYVCSCYSTYVRLLKSTQNNPKLIALRIACININHLFGCVRAQVNMKMLRRIYYENKSMKFTDFGAESLVSGCWDCRKKETISYRNLFWLTIRKYETVNRDAEERKGVRNALFLMKLHLLFG